MQSKAHWEQIYTTKPADGVSWFQQHAAQSLRLLRNTGVPLSAAIIDVGGGAATLVDDLVDSGYSNLTVLDVAGTALAKARARLGEKADRICWLEGDVTRIELRSEAYDVWHDRAVFHFLNRPADREAYVAQILHAVKPGGHVIIATFAEDGPQKCSGLPVVRYSPEQLGAELGARFDPVEQQRETHQTPFATSQKFIYCRYRKLPS